MQHPENNALTEVALALAMAFFAIFIVAAVSMNPVAGATPSMIDLAAPTTNSSTSNTSAPQWLIHTSTGFVDAQFKPIDPQQLDPQRPVHLAVAPNLPANQMLQLQKQISHPNLSITLLNVEWQQYLEQKP